MSNVPSAVLWDMDGTLVDTEPYWIECEFELVATHGNGNWTLEHAHHLVGTDLLYGANYIRTHGSVDLDPHEIVDRLLDGVIARIRANVPWRPGAKELLASLRRSNVPNALVTMSWRKLADAVVNTLPPGTFRAVVCGDEVDHGKPHRQPYVRAAQLLGVPPGECVALEDSPTGIASAVAAGCRTIAVPHIVPIPRQRGVRIEPTLVGLTPTDLVARRHPPSTTRRRRNAFIAAGVVTAVVAGGGWLAFERLAAPTPPDDIAIAAWAPYWTLDRSTTAVESYGDALTELSPFWYEAVEASTIGLHEQVGNAPIGDFIAEAKRQAIPLIPTITDGMAANQMAAVLADPGTRAAHVTAIVDLVTANDFAGIDIDYESFAFNDGPSTWDATRPNWIAFIAELGASLHRSGRLLSVSAPPPNYTVYAYGEIAEHVDRLRIMAYDYSVAEPGPIAPLDRVESAIDQAKREVDDDSRLVLGVPLYGRNWLVSTIGQCPADAPGSIEAVPLYAIPDLLARRGATPTRDVRLGESSFTYSAEFSDGVTTCTQTRQVNYVDALGVADRVDLARRKFLGGASLWALGFDDPSTWNAIANLARDRP